jgi:3-phenylpropionate/trans-cinnamate dioxygenase ferredoxin reductase subunit
LFGISMRVEHWTNASDQAAHAARALVHGAEAAGAFAPVPYFWSDQHRTKLQFVGTSAATDDVVVVEGSVDDRKFVAGWGRDGVTVGGLCVNWPARMVPWSKAIGAREAFPPGAAG